MNVAIRIDVVGAVIEEIREASKVRLAELAEVEEPVEQIEESMRFSKWMTSQFILLRDLDTTDGRIEHFMIELNKSFCSAVVNSHRSA